MKEEKGKEARKRAVEDYEKETAKRKEERETVNEQVDEERKRLEKLVHRF